MILWEIWQTKVVGESSGALTAPTLHRACSLSRILRRAFTVPATSPRAAAKFRFGQCECVGEGGGREREEGEREGEKSHVVRFRTCARHKCTCPPKHYWYRVDAMHPTSVPTQIPVAKVDTFRYIHWTCSVHGRVHLVEVGGNCTRRRFGRPLPINCDIAGGSRRDKTGPSGGSGCAKQHRGSMWKPHLFLN